MTALLRHIFARAGIVLVMFLGTDAGAQAEPKAAKPAGVTPVRDPADMPFRRAPMGPSSRSIVVSLATNVHLAFDPTLARTHTVSEGPSLNLYGPPFTDTATRFICDFSGQALWETLPVSPWAAARPGAGSFDRVATRFLGVSTKGGQSSFLYEVIQPAGRAIQVQETPRLERVSKHDAVIRRFAIGPLMGPVRLSPFHGAGVAVPLPGVQNAVAIRREKDFLFMGARGLAENVLVARPNITPGVIPLQSERDGKGPYSVVVTNAVSGPQVEVTLTLPGSGIEQVIEVATVVCANEAEATALARAFAGSPVKAPRASLTARLPQVLAPDPAFKGKWAGDDAFTVEPFPLPKEIKLMVGGMDFLPNGDLAICTYAGEVWIIEGATGDPAKARWRRFARGLNEPGGLRVVNGAIYVTQKCELTRLTDTDADGEADLFECISDAWGYTGNYHSYATGPALDATGNLYVMVTGHRTIYDVPYMGWSLRVTRDAQTSSFKPQNPIEGFCSGLRVPNGFGEFQGEIFMTDNQGHWIAANKLNHLQAGKFYGHPSAQPESRSRFDGDKDFTPPVVWFPYAWVRSASGIAAITDDRLGPFKGQMLVGEFQNANIYRVALERVNGQWQGAVFPFVKGFGSGVNRLAFGPEGKLYAGGLRMGHWTSIGPRAYSVDRVSFTGKTPFEIRDVRAQPDGFVLTFTQPVEAASAGDAENWNLVQYTYAYDGKHNSPEKDRDEKIPGPPARVLRAEVAADKLSVRLHTEGCKPLHVISVRAVEVNNAAGGKLRHDTFHYTLNQVPGSK
jgi:glucose/arabinose dehydrogenase